jgi:hypothetical protein
MRERTPLLHLPVHLSDSRTALHCVCAQTRPMERTSRNQSRESDQIRSDECARAHSLTHHTGSHCIAHLTSPDLLFVPDLTCWRV